MIDKLKISNIMAAANDNGYEVSMKDVLYCILLRNFNEPETVYENIYSLPYDDKAKKFCSDKKFTLVQKLIKKEDSSSHVSLPDEYDDISFEENKDAMVKLLSKLDSDVQAGVVDVEKAYMIETNIRKTLVSTFATNKKIDEQVIKVETKFNDVCPYCHHEISAKVITKEEAMKIYSLKEINNGN